MRLNQALSICLCVVLSLRCCLLGPLFVLLVQVGVCSVFLVVLVKLSVFAK